MKHFFSLLEQRCLMSDKKALEPTRILLLRHGHVENPEARFYSQQDVPLSEKGVKQSQEVARLLEPLSLDAVFSSDLSRSLYLARLISEPRGLSPVVRQELREVDFGSWSGLTWKEIEELYPGQFLKRMQDLQGFRPPNGENLKEVQRRTAKVIEEIALKMRGATVAVVAHGGTNRVIVSHLLSLPIQKCFSIGQDYCCINEILLFQDGNVVIERLNWKIGGPAAGSP